MLKRLFGVVLLACLALTQVHATGGFGPPFDFGHSRTVVANYVGANAFQDIGYSSNEQPFLNIFKQAGSNTPYEPWFTMNGSNSDTNEEAYLSAQPYKWNPGWYALSVNQPVYAGEVYSGSNTESDVTKVVASSPTVRGLTFWEFWSAMESGTLGNYTFQGCTNPVTQTGCSGTSVLDKALNALRANNQHAIIVLFPNSSFGDGTSPPTAGDNNGLPGYITSSTGTYGAGNAGCGMSSTSASGWWANGGGGYTANIENANVQARLNALGDALAAVYDNDPAVEGFMFNAMDWDYPCQAGLQGSAFYTAWEAVISHWRAAFKHTSISIQVAFGTGGSQMEDFTTWLVQNGGMVSASDMYGHTAWTAYQLNTGNCSSNGTFTGIPSGTSASLVGTWTCGGMPAASGQTENFKLSNSGQILNSVHIPQNFSGSTSLTWTGSVTGNSSDTFAYVNAAPLLTMQAGMQAYMGISPAGSGYTVPSPALQTYSTSWPLVEAPDMCAEGAAAGGGVYGFAVDYLTSDIAAAANLTGSNGYNASHVSVSMMDSGQCPTATGQWTGGTGVLAQMAANPLTQLSYPSVYGNTSAVLDTDGYPTTMTVSGIPGGQVFSYYSTWMNVNIPADTPIPGASCTYVAACSSPPTYRLRFQGKGTIKLLGVSGLACSSCSGLTISSGSGYQQVASTNAWGTTDTLTFTMGTSNGLQFQITALPDSANYIKAISIVDNSLASSYDGGEIFHPKWLAAMNNNGAGGLQRMRTQVLAYNAYDVQLTFTGTLSSGSNSGTIASNGVQWGYSAYSSWPMPSGFYSVVFATGQTLSCNFTYLSTAMSGCTANFSAAIPTSSIGAQAVVSIIPTWSARSKLSNATWSTWRGTPLEVIIQACNELGADCWMNIPASLHVVDSAYSLCASGYAENLANLLFNGTCKDLSNSVLSTFTGLGATHVAYIEYSNEISGAWNGAQPYIMGGDMMKMLGKADGFYAAQGNNQFYGAAEEYGKQVAGIGDAFNTIYGGSLASRVKVVMATQFATGNGVGFMEVAMNTPDWSSHAYSHHVGVLSFAPYMAVDSMSSSDIAHLIGLGSQSTQLTELFSLAYTNVGASAFTYSSLPAAGYVGDALGTVNGSRGMTTGWASQPWASLPVATYEGGIGADDRLSGGDTNYTNWAVLETAFLRDTRAQYLYYDPTHVLSSNPGYLSDLQTQGITVTKLDFVHQTTDVTGNFSGGWGALENINQTTTPLSSAPPSYQGLMKFAQ